MMRKCLPLLTVVLLVLSSCAGCTTAYVKLGTRLPVDEPAALRMETADNLCSGTAIAPHTILSAAHCFKPNQKHITINEMEANIIEIFTDGRDHALVVVDIKFDQFAMFGPESEKGDDIYYWGNPSLDMQYRKGYVTGFRGYGETLYDINGFHGDSGAGVFDKHRRLVAVVSFITRNQDFRLIGSYPFSFTEEQIKAAGLPSDDPYLKKLLMTTTAPVLPELDWSAIFPFGKTTDPE